MMKARIYTSISPVKSDTAEVWQATCGLKFKGAVLHQAWQRVGDGRVEWRPVPHDGPYGDEQR